MDLLKGEEVNNAIGLVPLPLFFTFFCIMYIDCGMIIWNMISREKVGRCI